MCILLKPKWKNHLKHKYIHIHISFPHKHFPSRLPIILQKDASNNFLNSQQIQSDHILISCHKLRDEILLQID